MLAGLWHFQSLLAFVMLLFVALPGQASADGLIVIPAEKFITSPAGVDLRTGRYAFNQTDISGPDAAGLPLSRIMPDYVANHANPFGNISSNWDIFLLETRTDLTNGGDYGNDYRMTIHAGGRAVTFFSYLSWTGYQYQGTTATQTLTYTSGTKASGTAVYTYVDADGSVMTFHPIGNFDCADQTWGSYPRRCAYVSSIVQPDGTQLNFSYAYNSGASGNRARLTSITSSRGYALLFEGSGSTISKACLISTSRTVMPTSGACPTDAVATVSYGYAGAKLTSVTDASGQIWGLTYATVGSSVDMGFVKPGQSAPWLVNNYTLRRDEEGAFQEIVGKQTFADGHVYNYDYFETIRTTSRTYQTIMGGSYGDSVGNGGSVAYDFPIKPGSRTQYFHCMDPPCPEIMPDDELDWSYQVTPGPVSIDDGIGVTAFDYCDPATAVGLPSYEPDRCAVQPYHNVTDPEGISSEVKYDGCANINKVERSPKPGSTLPMLTTSATYDCGNPKAQTKPTTLTDAKGNVTNFAYSTDHGGVRYEMDPPPSSGAARPLKLYDYAQRYTATKDATGTPVAAPPVWVSTGMTQCQTAAGTNTAVCDTAAPQLATVNEYGAPGTAEALLIKGIAVTSGGQTLRTCYTYDVNGRKVSETRPLGTAALSVCP